MTSNSTAVSTASAILLTPPENHRVIVTRQRGYLGGNSWSLIKHSTDGPSSSMTGNNDKSHSFDIGKLSQTLAAHELMNRRHHGSTSIFWSSFIKPCLRGEMP